MSRLPPIEELMSGGVPVEEGAELSPDRGRIRDGETISGRTTRGRGRYQTGTLQNTASEPLVPDYVNLLFNLGLVGEQDPSIAENHRSTAFPARITGSTSTANDSIFLWSFEEVRREAGSLDYQTTVGGRTGSSARNIAEGSPTNPPSTPATHPEENDIVLMVELTFPSGQRNYYFWYSVGTVQHYAKLTSATQDGSNYRWTYEAVRATIDKDASGITASDFDDTTEEIEVYNWLELHSSTSLWLNSPTGNADILPLTNLSAGAVYVPITFTGQTNASDKRIAWCSVPNPYSCPS